MRRTATSVRFVNRMNASSIWPGVVFESTTMKFDVLRASTLPTPARSIPVTVSSSPMTAMSDPTAAFAAALPPMASGKFFGAILLNRGCCYMCAPLARLEPLWC